LTAVLPLTEFDPVKYSRTRAKYTRIRRHNIGETCPIKQIDHGDDTIATVGCAHSECIVEAPLAASLERDRQELVFQADERKNALRGVECVSGCMRMWCSTIMHVSDLGKLKMFWLVSNAYHLTELEVDGESSTVSMAPLSAPSFA
jgi:hypothetical protein